MTTIVSLLDNFKTGTVSFDDVLEVVPTLEWATKVTDPDGTVDWVGENYFGAVDNAVLEGVISAEQRELIVEALFSDEITEGPPVTG